MNALIPSQSLVEIDSTTLVTRLDALVADERRQGVSFLRHLAEMERRRLHLDLGFSSLFVYCAERLRLPKASAFRRTTAARLLVRFPTIGEFLEDGRLNLTTLCELRDVLSEENHVEILGRAAGMSEE